VLLDVDRRELVLAHQLLADQDGVLVVAALPGHEGRQYILAQREFAHLGGGRVTDHVPLLHDVPLDDHRVLVNAGGLVRALELAQRVRFLLAIGGLDDHLRAGGAHHPAGAPGSKHLSRIDGRLGLHAGAHYGRLSAQERHGLALHVGAHQGAVGIIVLQERDQRRRNAYHLLRRHVHVRDAIRRLKDELVVHAGRDALVYYLSEGVQAGVRLRDNIVLLVVRR